MLGQLLPTIYESTTKFTQHWLNVCILLVGGACKQKVVNQYSLNAVEMSATMAQKKESWTCLWACTDNRFTLTRSDNQCCILLPRLTGTFV